MLGRITTQLDAEGVTQESVAEPAATSPAWTRVLLPAAGLITLVVGWYAAQVAMLNWIQPRSLSSNLSAVEAPIRPDTPIQLELSGYGAELGTVQLYRSDSLTNAPEQAVAARAVSAESGSWRLDVTDGLKPDSSYRLVVETSSPSPSLPMPVRERSRQQFQFETVPTPRATLPSAPVQPRWDEAVSVSWSLPLESVQVAVKPEAAADAWVDPKDATRTWVKLAPTAPSGQTYSVSFTQARGIDGMPLQVPASFQIVLPERPRFENAPDDTVTLKPGQTFDLNSTVPLTDIKVETSGDLQTKATLVGQKIHIETTRYRQGAEAQVKVTGATTRSGAPLEAPVIVTLRTPAPMELPKFVPNNGAKAVPLRSRPYLEFDAPPADPDAVKRSVMMRPPINGQWNWLDDTNLVFTPADRLPPQTTINVTLRSGPNGPHNGEGGYLEKDLVASFVTAPNRRIEVSLSKQQLYMYENDRLIKTVTVGTGVPGAETPLGNYEVLYKLPKTRMQGTNPSGLTYDIPDVPWVLPFLGDYALHGVNWRNNFGTPASNGCVGMPVEDAKFLYDWADPGTPIRIYQ